MIVTVAGTGTPGYSGDGGPATNAKMSDVYALAFDKHGNFYFSDDANPRVRKVTPSGVITLIAGSGVAGYGGDGGPAIYASIGSIYGIAVDTFDNIYIADGGNARIRKITPDGIIRTIAGIGIAGYNGDYLPATDAQLNGPASVAVDDTGNLYICDRYNYRLRKVNTAGIINTIAGSGINGYAMDGAIADTSSIGESWCIVVNKLGEIFFNDERRIRKILPGVGTLLTMAGTSTTGYSGDGGPATSATINTELFTVDTIGNLYLGEGSNRIRKVNTEGTINTIAGTGTIGIEGDGVGALSAKVNSPFGVAFSPEGELHFCDRSARIRKITAFWSSLGYSPLPEESVKIFPNPATNEVYIDVLTREPELTLVTVFDAAGKLVYEKQVATNVLQSIKSEWPAGSYTIRVGYGQKITSKQIIIANK